TKVVLDAPELQPGYHGHSAGAHSPDTNTIATTNALTADKPIPQFIIPRNSCTLVPVISLPDALQLSMYKLIANSDDSHLKMRTGSKTTFANRSSGDEVVTTTLLLLGRKSKLWSRKLGKACLKVCRDRTIQRIFLNKEKTAKDANLCPLPLHSTSVQSRAEGFRAVSLCPAKQQDGRASLGLSATFKKASLKTGRDEGSHSYALKYQLIFVYLNWDSCTIPTGTSAGCQLTICDAAHHCITVFAPTCREILQTDGMIREVCRWVQGLGVLRERCMVRVGGSPGFPQPADVAPRARQERPDSGGWVARSGAEAARVSAAIRASVWLAFAVGDCLLPLAGLRRHQEDFLLNSLIPVLNIMLCMDHGVAGFIKTYFWYDDKRVPPSMNVLKNKKEYHSAITLYRISHLAPDNVNRILEDSNTHTYTIFFREEEKRKHKKKRLVQSPNSYFMDTHTDGTSDQLLEKHFISSEILGANLHSSPLLGISFPILYHTYPSHSPLREEFALMVW
ncbi:hypothetical protein E2I00_018038, partial [Balaenoptera physalus]